MSTLEIRSLHVQVLPADGSAELKEILKGVNLTTNSGGTHAVMGPNGPSKPALNYTIVGHPRCEVTGSEILLDGENVLETSADEHVHASLFLTIQYPVEVTGVSMSNFLRSAATAIRGEAPKLHHWTEEARETAANLEIDSSFSERSVNEGFSGGEKKRHEALRLDLLKLKFAILGETGSGLNVDALRVVSGDISRYQDENSGGILIVTYYRRILNYVRPNFVHVFHGGRFIISGGLEPTDEPEGHGHKKYINVQC